MAGRVGDAVNGTQRFHVALVAVFLVVSAAVLWGVWATVFFAVTVAYVADPFYSELRARGLAPWWASLLTTTGVFVFVISLIMPFALVLYQRRADIVDALESLPDEVVLESGAFRYPLEVAPLVDSTVALLRGVAVDVVAATPVLGLKLTVFAMVLFALLVRRRQVTAAVRSAIPGEYRPVAEALARRTRETLVAIYVLQAVTAIVTFFAALVVFGAFGYSVPFLLAVLAGILQFLPIIGPTLVVLAVVVYELTLGNVVRAAVVGIVAWVLVAYLPDPVIRPRLAERTANLPGSLYFVGFTGGLLTIGPVGIIVGPVVVGLFVESFTLLSTATAAGSASDGGPPDEPALADGAVEPAAGSDERADQRTEGPAGSDERAGGPAERAGVPDDSDERADEPASGPDERD